MEAKENTEDKVEEKKPEMENQEEKRPEEPAPEEKQKNSPCLKVQKRQKNQADAETYAYIKSTLENIVKRFDDLEDMRAALDRQNNLSNEQSTMWFNEMMEFLTGFRHKVDELIKSFDNEILFKKDLENQIARKTTELECLQLKKLLEEERANFTIAIEKFDRAQKEGINLLVSKQEQSTKAINTQLEGFNEKIKDYQKLDNAFDESIKNFSSNITNIATSELKKLRRDSEDFVNATKKTVDDIKDSVIKYLGLCEKQNADLIKKIPEKSSKVCLKDILIYSLCGMNVIGWIAMLVGMVR